MKKTVRAWASVTLMVMLLSGCAGNAKNPVFTEAAAESISTLSVQTAVTDVQLADEYFSSRDLDPSYDTSAAVKIRLPEDSVDGRVVIAAEGIYVLSGSLEDGQIYIDCDKSDKVQLVLDGVNITSRTSAAIYAKQADKVFLTLAPGSENVLANGGSYIAIDDNNIDAVIFSKTDLTLNGSGSLRVEAAAGHGIVSKDELTITGGTYFVTAAEHGFVGKDSVAIADGSFTVTTGGGSSAVAMKSSDAMGGGRMNQKQAEVTDTSAKGIKSDGPITVLAGSFTLDTADDAVHSGGDLSIAGGDWNIRTADDAIHADSLVTIQSGSFTIPYCYEGIEGQSVTIDGGTFDIRSYDDGINAAGGMDASGFGGNGERFGGGSNAIIVNGGSIIIVSDGDSLDANGTITLNGGTLNLTCNGNGNTALDCDGGFTNNGAEVTTNDGSENGGSFGGHGFGGMMGGMKGQRPGTDGQMPQRPDMGGMENQRPNRSFGGQFPDNQLPEMK